MLRECLLDMLRLRRERRTVDADARALDVDQHGNERHLELPLHLLELIGHQQRRETIRQLPRKVGAFARESEK